MKFVTSTIQLSDGSSFNIVHNLEEMIEAAAVNWSVRTDDYTAESFCNYINSKREKGLTDHYAFTEEQYRKMIEEK